MSHGHFPNVEVGDPYSMISGTCRTSVIVRIPASKICVTCRWASAIHRRELHYAFRPFKNRKRPSEHGLGGGGAASQRHASKKSRPKNAESLYLPQYPTRTRFAPSPTGQLHIGGLRTALFSFLIAKRTHGQFILRIEDTDQKRLVPGAEQQLIDDLRWAGLTWDEGPDVGGPYGPYRQSDRNALYQSHAEQLLDSGEAYRCFCTAQTSQTDHNAFVTSGCYQSCSSLDIEEASYRANVTKTPFTVRLHKQNQKNTYPDLVYGNIVPLKRSAATPLSADYGDSALAADTILVKSDGTPTYHFANVIDDHLMNITHVIRGTEWMASTPLHVDLYRAFGWDPPIFAHVGLLVNEEQSKLSKRDKDLALDVAGMRDERHILPEALCNFLALLGWRFPGRDETCTMDDLIKQFDLRFTRGNAMVTMAKLDHLQKKHARRRCDEARATDTNAPIEYMIDAMIDEIRLQCPDAENEIGGRSSLVERCAEILLHSTQPYNNPRQFVEQNRHLLPMSRSSLFANQQDNNLAPAVPQAPEKQYEGVSAEVKQLAKALLEDFGFGRSYRAPLFPGLAQRSPSDGKHQSFRNVSRTGQLINAAIENMVWREIVPDASADDLPFTNEPVDNKAYAMHFARDDAQQAEQLLTAFMTMRMSLLRYLRAALVNNHGGMQVTYIMAILSYQECCRRMGVSPRAGGGW